MNEAVAGMRVFVHGPNNEIVGWVYLHEAMRLAKEADCDITINTHDMHAYIHAGEK